MPASADLVAHILDLLSNWGGVTARRQFSGYGFYRGGAMLALITGADILYFRTDARNRPDFEAAGSKPFTYEGAKGRIVTLPYWEAPPALFDDEEEMIAWARKAYEAALVTRREKLAKRVTTAKKKAAPRKKSAKPKPKKQSSPRTRRSRFARRRDAG